MLATCRPAAVRKLYEAEPDVVGVRLARELGQVRRRGFAVNDQSTEVGLTALGMGQSARTSRWF